MRTQNSEIIREIEKIKKRKSFFKKMRKFLRYFSFSDYRTPLYFNKRDAYVSASSGLLTIVLVILLAILALSIFIPIFKLDYYQAEEEDINLRGTYKNDTLEECVDCRIFTVRDAIKKIFNGSFKFVVLTPFKPTAQTCKAYKFYEDFILMMVELYPQST